MFRRVTGNVLIAALGVTLFSKAATSFPLLPRPSDIPQPVLSDSPMVMLAAGEATDEGLVAESSEDTPAVMFGNDNNAFPQCDTPELVLQSLQRERALLETQLQGLSEREATVALAEEKLAIEREALIALKSSIEELMGQVESQKTADLERLVAVYQNMKPVEAATIMNDMDIEVMIMVLGTMPPRVAAPIIAKMSPVRARAVSKIILERSKLPGDQNLSGVRFN